MTATRPSLVALLALAAGTASGATLTAWTRPSAPTVLAKGDCCAHPKVAPIASASRIDVPPLARGSEGRQAATGSVAAAGPAASARELRAPLVALVDELRASGRIADHDLLAFALQPLIAQGRAELALELALELRSPNAHVYLRLAAHFESRGKLDLAAQAARAGLACGGDCVPFARHAPDEVLARLKQRVALADDVARAFEIQRYLEVLDDLDRLDEGREAVEELLERDPRDERALSLFAKLDPLAAEARLRELHAARGGSDDWSSHLIDLYVGDGRPLEAEAVLRERELESGRGDPLRWGEIAEHHVDNGDVARAADAWLAALERETGDPDRWTSALREHAPARLLAFLEAKALEPEVNDEFWGALGDARWIAGRRDAGLAAWQRALALDPTDREWRRKLDAARAGGEPLD